MQQPTFLNGQPVIGFEIGAAMPWLARKVNGEYARTKQANTAHLANGETIYLCAIDPACTFTAPHIQAITASHGPKVHGTANGGPGKWQKAVADTTTGILDMSLRDFIAWVSKNQDLLDKAQETQDRLAEAEKQLRAIRRQFS